MRKIIIFSLIMIVLTGAVFADNNAIELHSVKLKTVVRSYVPAFQLEFTSGMKNPSDSVVTNLNKEEFGSGDYNEYASNDTAIEVYDISKRSLDFVFTAKLANSAKCSNSYTLKFSAGSFDVFRNEVSGTLDPETPIIRAASDLSARLGVSAEPPVAGESIKMRFTGAQCSPGALAIFEVKYSSDSSIDPTKGGAYYADISLEVSSDN